MAKAKSIPKPLSSYEQLGMRIQRAINAPQAQASKSVLLERSENDAAADWDQILEEIAENDNVTVAHRDDGLTQLFWVVPRED